MKMFLWIEQQSSHRNIECVHKQNEHCSVPENIHTPPQKGLEFPGGRVSVRPKKFMEMYETQSQFPFRGGIWIFSGIFWDWCCHFMVIDTT